MTLRTGICEGDGDTRGKLPTRRREARGRFGPAALRACVLAAARSALAF